MRKITVPIVVAVALLGPSLAAAQGASVEFRVDLPAVLPRLVVVSPGVQVVPEVDQEVFLVDGWYWVRHDNGWYRSRSHRGGWVLVGPRGVPARLVKIPPGKYRRFRPVPAPARPAPAMYRERDDDRRDGHERREKHDKPEKREKHDRKDKHGRGHEKHGD